MAALSSLTLALRALAAIARVTQSKKLHSHKQKISRNNNESKKRAHLSSRWKRGSERKPKKCGAMPKKRPYEVRDRQPTDDDAFLMAKSRGSDRPHHGRIFRVQVGPSPRTAGEARKRPRPGRDPIARLNLWRALRGEGGGVDWGGAACTQGRTHARRRDGPRGRKKQPGAAAGWWCSGHRAPNTLSPFLRLYLLT